MKDPTPERSDMFSVQARREFETKRRRWAEILVVALTFAIVLALVIGLTMGASP